MPQELSYLKETPSQTAGPYVHIGLSPRAAGFDIFKQELGWDIAGPNALGERIRVEGLVIDGTGSPVKDVLLEAWQANAEGVYAHTEDGGAVEDGFRGWGRIITDFETGSWAFETVKPGRPKGRNIGLQAPHINLWLVARGINIGLNTRMYFGDEIEANAEDPVLNLIEWERRRSTLVAERSVRNATTVYRFDIKLQGDDETVFFRHLRGLMDKTVANLNEAVSRIEDGATVMIGGFGGSGAPIELIHALIDEGPKGLTVINNNAGNGHVGIAAMIEQEMVAKMVCSFPRSIDPRAFTERYLAGKIELEIVPQGTLAERIRAGGAGIPAFYTPTGFGTDVAEGKPVAEFDGKSYVQERWLKADVALIKAEVGDPQGNLTYRMAARNFNPLMAMASETAIAQVSSVVSVGSIDPEQVVTPGIFIDRIVEVAQSAQEEDLNRRGAVYPEAPVMSEQLDTIKLSNAQIAWRAAQDIEDGAYVNLGIGFPEMIAKFQPEGREVIYHTENGILGFGAAPPEGEEDWDLINAGKKAVTLNPGAAFFHHADSFAMVRGGHLDLAVLGAYQVAENGDLANWSTGKGGIPAIGGAMDLVHGARKVAVVTDHVTKKGAPKLVDCCTMPLTGVGCIDRVYTSLAVINIRDGRFVLREKLPRISFDDLQAVTGATLHINGSVRDLVVPAV